MEDTICAISTSVGVGGISIIRISGEDSIEIANSIFKGKDLTKVDSHTINYGYIYYKDNIIDEVLVSVMKAPKTYTTEDIVEINLHGGIATTNKVLQILLESGCRLAEPGEFTKRAFLNGRIDLVEAEAVSDIINASTENARSLSINQVSGKLSDVIKDLKNKLLEIEANIEVNIDYPEYEDIEDMDNSKVIAALKTLNSQIESLIKESQNGKIIKNGINIAIVGRPNVGKSSILNAMINENRAIVTDIEGTTRDIIEASTIINGNLINFIDTAGIRDTDNLVEQIGVSKSYEYMDKADLILFVINGSQQITDEEKELLKRIENKKHIIFINKNDLPNKLELSIPGAIYGNTLDTDGLDKLKERISELFNLEEISNKDYTYISNARQLSLIEKALSSLQSAATSLENSVPVDIVSIDLKNAREYFGEILGETYKDELLDELFSKFCLGK